MSQPSPLAGRRPRPIMPLLLVALVICLAGCGLRPRVQPPRIVALEGSGDGLRSPAGGAGGAQGAAAAGTAAAGVGDGAAGSVTGAPASTGGGPYKTPEPIYVHVSGSVKRPGVYRLLSGARACDALALAGGETSEACLDAVNLAAVLTDGQQLYVPAKREVQAGNFRVPAGPAAGLPGSGTGRGQALQYPLDVNLARAAELESLPGIGPVLAERIVAYREANGPFAEPEDLLKVSGIGPKTLEGLRRFVTVR